jgi:hypothetical protein
VDISKNLVVALIFDIDGKLNINAAPVPSTLFLAHILSK